MKILQKRLGVAMIWVVVFLFISVIVSNTAEDNNAFADTKLDVCVFDEDGTEASKALAEFIGTKHNIITLNNNKDDILDALYYETADYVLTIKEGYAEKLAAGDTEGLFSNYHVHDSYSSMLMGNLLDEYAKTASAYIAAGQDMETAVSNTEKAMSKEVEVRNENFGDSKKGSESREFYFYFQYLPYVLISVMVVGLCPVLIKLNDKEIKNRTNCSCITVRSQTAQIFLGSVIFVIAVWLVFMVAGAFIRGGMYSGRMWLDVLNSFVFVIISAGIAILISAFAPSDTGLNVVANILGLGMSFLCGVFVPQYMLDDGVLSAARFLPAYWYIKANDMLSGASGEVFSNSLFFEYIGIEAVFAVVIFAVTIVVMKVKHDKV